MSKKRANGDAKPYEIKSKGLWAISVDMGTVYDEKSGSYKRKRKTLYGKTKTEVMNKKQQFQFGVFTGEFVDKNHITICQLAKQLLDDDLDMNTIQQQTHDRNIETLKRLKSIYNTPLQTANETQIRNFLLSEKKYSQSVIKKEYTLLKRTFNEAVRRGIIAKSPMADVKAPKSTKKTRKIRAMTLEEQNKLLNVLMTADVNYSHQMLLSMFTGMRMGEVNALKKSDINYTFKSIYVHSTISRDLKGHAFINDEAKTDAGTRTIKITNDVKRILDEVMAYAEGEMLFTKNNDGKTLINTSSVNMQFQRTLEKYSIINKSIFGDVTVHSLRHTYGTRCIEGGMSPKVLQTIMGHTDIKVTLNTYADAFEEFQNDDIEKYSRYMKEKGLSISEPEDSSVNKNA